MLGMMSGEYFRTLGWVMAQGRDFADADVLGGGSRDPGEVRPRHLFPHESPIGRTLKLGVLDSKYPWMPIVGVVRDNDQHSSMVLELGVDTTREIIFLSTPVTAQLRERQAYAIRAAQGATGVRIGVQRAMHDSAPERQYHESRAVGSGLQHRGHRRAVFLRRWSSSPWGAASLALGAAGVFSVVSYIADSGRASTPCGCAQRNARECRAPRAA